MSNLMKHARQELALLNNGSDIDEPLLQMVQIFSDMGHSGSSAEYCRGALNELLAFRNLSPLTDDPEEWEKHSDVWQNRRRSEAFSSDEGKSYWLLSDGASMSRQSPKYETKRVV